MINKLSAPRKLLLLVTVMSVFITGIGIYGISEMRAMQQQTKTLYADRVLPLEQLNNVRFNYLLGIIASVEQVHAHRLDFAEAIQKIEEAEASIKKNWDIYLTTYLTPEEKKLVDEAAVLLKTSGETVQRVKVILQNKDAVALNSIINNDFYPGLNPVLSKMNELLQLQVRVGKEVYDNSTATYYSSLKKFILLIALSLAFAIPFCYYLTRKVNRLIENLHTSNAIIAKSEKKCRALIENAGDAIFMLNNDTVITDVNDYACRLLGYSRKELVGMKIASLLSTEERKKQIAYFESIHQGKAPPLSERRLTRKDGSEVDTEINARVLEGEGYISIIRDITYRKIAEEAIRQSEANYRQLFKLSPAPMWVLDDQSYRFIQVNQAAVNHYGYTEEEFSAMTIQTISQEEQKIPVVSGMGVKGHPAITILGGSRHIKKSGEIMDVETSSIPVILNGKKQILFVSIDITERNRYEHQLTKAAIKAQEEERYEIGGELHDNVCQLLATSLLTLGMLKKPLSLDFDKHLDQTQGYIKKAAEEIRNLSHRLAPAFFDEATLEYAFDTLLKNVNVEKKYSIYLDFDRSIRNYPLPRDLQLNLYRILQEQLRNILKYAYATQINVSVSVYDDVLQMSISDNGVGFDAAGSKKGIGQANMNRRVQLFSGKLFIESAPGKGCELIVEIPVA